MSLSPLAPRAARLRGPRAGAWPALARLAALALALGACTDFATQPRDDQARLIVSAAVAGTPIGTIVITVSAADIARPLVFNLSVHDGLATGTLHVPPGPARLFTAQGFDAAGEVTHEGTATADIKKGDNDALSIAMLPRAGQVPITVTVGSVRVVVSPASAALAVGATQQLAAAVTYEGGEAVPGAAPAWASANPAVASVDPSGLVTAHAAGQAQIMAVFAGSAGVSAVTVSTARDPSAAKIAFTSNRDGNWEIYVMNADGTGQTRLTNDPAIDDAPAWSPDGTRIAFVSAREGNAEIYVMNADGTGQTRLTNDPGYDDAPAWSPDGTRIAFTSYRDSTWEVYAMNPDGTGQTRLTNDPYDYSHPAWSPNGALIAVSSYRGRSDEIYVMNADGTAQMRLTSNLAGDGRPAWSPDGARIVFASFRDGNEQIYVMNADGTGQTRLTNDAANDDAPAWSPDGTRLAFASNRDGNWEVYVMNADGTGQTRLTINTAGNYAPAWR